MHEEPNMKYNTRMGGWKFSANVPYSQKVETNVPLRMETSRNHALNPKPKTQNPRVLHYDHEFQDFVSNTQQEN